MGRRSDSRIRSGENGSTMRSKRGSSRKGVFRRSEIESRRLDRSRRKSRRRMCLQMHIDVSVMK